MLDLINKRKVSSVTSAVLAVHSNPLVMNWQIKHFTSFHRYMFFSDWEAVNGQPGLERAFMDGTNRYGIIGSKLGWPAGITLDIEAKRIYWVDSRYDYIETATYDGLHR